jgi:hypothetical protein
LKNNPIISFAEKGCLFVDFDKESRGYLEAIYDTIEKQNVQ